MKVVNIFKHIKLVSKHKWNVFKLCCRVGVPWRGFAHDWSKFSPGEFFESIKYYDGHISPITVCKKVNGYSKAWLHHKGRNKHHAEYWMDMSLPEKTVIIPYKYAAEMICDKIAAGIVYDGKNWTKETEIKYYMNERKTTLVHPQTDKFIIAVLTEVSENGLYETLTKKNIKQLYEKYCVRMENLDENKIQTLG